MRTRSIGSSGEVIIMEEGNDLAKIIKKCDYFNDVGKKCRISHGERVFSPCVISNFTLGGNYALTSLVV